MKAFHGDVAVKKKYLERVRAHQAADRLIRGTGWEGNKGCAVGCTLENYDHSRYPIELGIPEWLARVEDTLFEGMSQKKSRTWPEDFLYAIPTGANLEPVKAKFFVVILKHSLVSVRAAKYDAEKFPKVKAAIEQTEAAVNQMIAAWENNDESAARSAWSAAESAWSAARSAESAARSAAWSAESAARSAESAARSAESAAAESAESAWSAAESAYDYYADELLKLLKGAA